MPKIIHTRPLFGTLDNMVWEPLEPTEEHEHRYLSPELTEEQCAHYLALSGFHAQAVEQKVLVPEVKPEITPVADKPAVVPEGSDAKIQEGAGAKKPAAKTQKTPARETPAQRKARLAAESQKGAE